MLCEKFETFFNGSNPVLFCGSEFLDGCGRVYLQLTCAVISV